MSNSETSHQVSFQHSSPLVDGNVGVKHNSLGGACNDACGTSCDRSVTPHRSAYSSVIPGAFDCFEEDQVQLALALSEAFRLKGARSDLSVALAAAHWLHMQPLQDAMYASSISAADKGKHHVHHATTAKLDNLYWRQTMYGLAYMELKKRRAIVSAAAMVSVL